MRVLLSTYGSRGDVEPMVALAVRLQTLGAQAEVCAPEDEEFAERLASLGVPFTPVKMSVRAMASGKPAPEDLPARAAALVAAQAEAIASKAQQCDAIVATGLIPAAAGARSIAEKLNIHYTYVAYFPTMLPSPHHPPYALPGRPHPADVTDNQALWNLNAANMNALFGPGVNAHRQSIALPPVADIGKYVYTQQPWLAADPMLAPWQEPAALDVVQTGAWFMPDERPLPAELVAFLDAGSPPVYVGFGSMSMHAAKDAAQVAIEAVRAQGHRVLLSRGWANLAVIDQQDDCFAVGEVNHQALFGNVAAVVHHGGAGTTTTATRAGAPQVIVPQLVDQPYWAARVAELGIGAAHDGPVPTVESLSTALGVALASETKKRAAIVADKISTDGTEIAAKLLLDRSA
ncbi:MAG: glycosyltransferase family 1 protein [Corynebacteriales bacterium]|nr:glycosyltransferase family 1 protein [Mycobacteriales bacterium]